jgi:hypothetical protein
MFERALSFLNDVIVGLVFGKGVLVFFSVASLNLWLVHGWERRRKARIVPERHESYGKGANGCPLIEPLASVQYFVLRKGSNQPLFFSRVDYLFKRLSTYKKEKAIAT